MPSSRAAVSSWPDTPGQGLLRRGRAYAAPSRRALARPTRRCHTSVPAVAGAQRVLLNMARGAFDPEDPVPNCSRAIGKFLGGVVEARSCFRLFLGSFFVGPREASCPRAKTSCGLLA
jgi:hypothetical protein